VIFVNLQSLVYLALFVIVLGLSVWGLIDAAIRPKQAFASAGKRTKTFWTLVLAGATAVAFVAVPYPIGIGQLGFLALIAAVAAIVYLVDVRPAVQRFSGRGGSGGRGRGGPSSRGGW
jgi:Protein of unknown function (DUF2516)